jgi:metal-responsive CopG/Arc/MetJ family transcriptional regulator
MKTGGREKGKKGLSYKLELKRLGVNVPVGLYSKLKEMSDRENKTISLIVTELLQMALREVDKKGNSHG